MPLLLFVAHGESLAGTPPSFAAAAVEAAMVIDHSKAEAVASPDIATTVEAEAETEVGASEGGMRMRILAPPLVAEEPVDDSISGPVDALAELDPLG